VAGRRPPTRTSHGLRHAGAIDKQIWLLERWLVGHLAGITDSDHAQLVRRFATSEVLPRLRARAEKQPVTPAARRHAGDQIEHATAFLGWLSERGQQANQALSAACSGDPPSDTTRPSRTPGPLARVLADHDLPLCSRVAAAIVLLYAQPLSRVVRLSIDDVIRDGDQVLLASASRPRRSPARSPTSWPAGSRTGTT